MKSRKGHTICRNLVFCIYIFLKQNLINIFRYFWDCWKELTDGWWHCVHDIQSNESRYNQSWNHFNKPKIYIVEYLYDSVRNSWPLTWVSSIFRKSLINVQQICEIGIYLKCLKNLLYIMLDAKFIKVTFNILIVIL